MHRYHDMDYMNHVFSMNFEDGLKLFIKALEMEAEETAWDQYLVYIGRVENPVPFDQFYKKPTLDITPPKTIDELVAKAELIKRADQSQR